MSDPKKRTTEDLLSEINKLESIQDLKKRERTALSKDINSRKKQIFLLEELVKTNNQYELYN